MSRSIKLSIPFKKFDFLKYYKKHLSNKYIYRCLACHYLQSGKSYKEVSSLLCFNKNSLIDWIKKFEEGGIDSLLSIRPGRGRKTALDNSQKKSFCSSVISLQEARSGGRITGDDIVTMISNNYKINYSRSGVYKVLSRMGMSWVSARSKHPKTDLYAQEDFKKNLPPK